MKKNISSWLSHMYVRLSATKRDYGAVDLMVLIYCGLVLLMQIPLQISPCVTFLATTPLYSIQTYMGLLGCALIVVDFFTTKKIWQGKYSGFLYAILVLAAVSSLRMIEYGAKENLFKLCWAGIQFVLMYSCVYRTDCKKFKKFFAIIYVVWLVIWTVSCCVSICQYAKQIGYTYVVNPLAKDTSINRQGFFDTRLFGIFYTLNHAAYISLILFLVGIVQIIRTKEPWVRITVIPVNLILLSHIILSGSRSAFVALFICMACLGLMIGINYVKKLGRIKILPVIFCALFAVVSFFVYKGMKEILPMLPYAVEKISASDEEYTDVEYTDEEQGSKEKRPEDYDDVLERQNLEVDPSNGRISIWKDYVNLFKEIGPIGLSPGNYMSYIYEHHQEMYIVDYIKTNYPAKYESGIIHHVHNGYLMVYVSAGWIGTLLLAAFIVLCIKRVIKKILRTQQLSHMFMCLLMLVLAVSISAVFDEGIFFQNNPQTTVFWIALGCLMKECEDSAGCNAARVI